MAEVKGPPARRPSVGRRVSTGMMGEAEIKDEIRVKVFLAFKNPKKVFCIHTFLYSFSFVF